MLRYVLPNPILQAIRRSRKWYWEKKLRNEFRPRDIICRVHGYEIKLRVSNGVELFRASNYQSKEPETLFWIDNNLREGEIFYDIGANVGLFSLYAAKRQPSATIIAFEPHPTNFARLCENVALNKLTNIVPLCLALSDEMSYQLLHLNSLLAGVAFNNVGSKSPHASTNVEFKQGVITHSVDELINAGKMPVPNLVKIDVDGIEDKILAGMDRVLSTPDLRSVLIELTDLNEKSVSSQMASHGLLQSLRGKDEQYSTGEFMRNVIFSKAISKSGDL